MRCTNCGGNPVHCKCPMPVNAVAVGAPVEHTPHLPQAVTAEPEQPTTQHRYPRRWLSVTGGTWELHAPEATMIYRSTNSNCSWESSMTPEALASIGRKETFDHLPPVVAAADEPPADWTAADLYDHIKRMRTNHATELNEAHTRITTLTADRDGARRALAGNIEVTERQLKEAGAEIERLKVMLARAIPYVEACIIDLENEVDHEYDHTEAQRAIGRQIHEGNEFRNEIITLLPASPNLQPGTEADHGTQQPA